tara:strand:+ start:296 stop:2038 length:1743 start_codon:yes stop_codon:yes gene_type:complete
MEEENLDILPEGDAPADIQEQLDEDQEDIPRERGGEILDELTGTKQRIYGREAKYGTFDQKVKDAKDLQGQDKVNKLREAGQKRKEIEEEIDPQTGWPMQIVKGAWSGLQKVGEAFDWVDDQAGIPGTDIDVYHARRMIIDPLSRQHFILGLLGEIFIPDSVDIATAGLTYIPNRFRKLGIAGAKHWAKIAKQTDVTTDFAKAQADWNNSINALAKISNIKGESRSFKEILNQEGLVLSLDNVDVGFNRSADDLAADIVGRFESNPNLGSRGFLGTTSFNGKQYTKTTLDSSNEINWTARRGDLGRRQAAEFTDPGFSETTFNALGDELKVTMDRIFDKWDKPLDRAGREQGWRKHHIAPVKQMAWAVNGLEDSARLDATNYIAAKLSQRLGMSGENLALIPHEFHIIMHRLINDNLGKYNLSKIEDALGINYQDISKLELWDRQEAFDLIVDGIMESREAISTFYQGLRLQKTDEIVDPDTLADVMENLLELNMRIFEINPDRYSSIVGMMQDILGQNREVLDFVTDELPAATRALRNQLYQDRMLIRTREIRNEIRLLERSKRGSTNLTNRPGLDFSE